MRDPHESFDSELSVRGIVRFIVGLVVLTAVVFLVMWLLYGRLRQRELAADPAPPPLPEARAERTPPEPRLQPSPPADLAALRTEEDALLNGYGWVDHDHAIARVPLERALLAAARGGLPHWPEVLADSAAAAAGGTAPQAEHPASPGGRGAAHHGSQAPAPRKR